MKEKDELESTAVDFAARIAFIIAFGLFNFFYWFILIYVVQVIYYSNSSTQYYVWLK